MGVYIKGMKMPRSCFECRLDLRTDVCQVFCEWKAKHPYSIRAKDRLPDCPIVEVPEPHGRLIDVDEICFSMTNGTDQDIAEEAIRESTTVIEAEGE